MRDPLLFGLPVPPALVYLLHQLRAHDIEYQLYGEITEAEMVFVDIDRHVAKQVDPALMPNGWSFVSPHFISHRALADGQGDLIASKDNLVEAIVIAYGGKEAEKYEFYQALCEQVRYLRQHSPSRLVYLSNQPPEPMEIQELIRLFKTGSKS